MNVSRLQPYPPFNKGGAENAPFCQGGRAQRGGILLRGCTNLMPFGLGRIQAEPGHEGVNFATDYR